MFTISHPSALPRRPRRLVALLGAALLALATLAAAQGSSTAAFDALLKSSVRDGVVDYPAFQDSAGFRAAVASYALPGAPEARGDKLAYAINAYNALAIAGILEGLSPSSLVGRTRYFKLKEWPFDGATITLDALEHKVLRPMGEPRIHFAIVCASKSCPPLRSEVYTPAKLDAQLDDQARRFVNDRSRNRFDAAARTARLSPIFDWFDADFKAAAGSTQKFLARYVADPAAAKLLAEDGFKIEWMTYDWSLNGTPPRR